MANDGTVRIQDISLIAGLYGRSMMIDVGDTLPVTVLGDHPDVSLPDHDVSRLPFFYMRNVRSQ